MSTNSYAQVSDIMALHGRMVQTAGISQDGLEIYLNMADGIANGILAGRYAVPLSAGWYPIEPLRTAVLQIASALFLASQAGFEDPGWYDRILTMRTQAEGVLKDVVDGKKHLVAYANSAGGAIRVPVLEDFRTAVWSSTKGYVPTMDLTPQEEQTIDSARLADERYAKGTANP